MPTVDCELKPKSKAQQKHEAEAAHALSSKLVERQTSKYPPPRSARLLFKYLREFMTY